MLHYVVISIQTKTNRQVLKFWDWLIEAKLQVCLLVQTGQQHVFEWLYCTSLTKGLVDNVSWVVEFLKRIYKFKDINTNSSMFWPDFAAKALLLVTPTELERFWPDFDAKALLLVTPTELEIFWPYFAANVLFLVTSKH